MYVAFDQLIDDYLEHNVGIHTSFLSKALAAGLHAHAIELEDHKKFRMAGVGKDAQDGSMQSFRGDSIYWLNKDHNNSFEKEFLEQMEGFIHRLNSTCYAGINDYEFHYAVYAKGTFYRRHKDQFRNDNKRKYSMINYLNVNWQAKDGGQLVVYNNEIPQKIEPESGTTVFFKSDELEHEVLATAKNRVSISGWLKS